jgi:long-subunit fatty acid transport protein
MDTTVDFSLPHIFKLGVAQGLLEDRLILAADLRYALFKDANEALVFEMSTPLGTAEQEMPLDWKNSIGVYLGGEYRVHELVRARAGYAVVSSATPEETAQAILPPPGLQHTIHLGAGVAVGGLEVDLGGYYLFGGKYADPDPTSGSAPGDYRFNAILGSLGVTYRFGAAGPADTPAPDATAGAG